MTFLLFSLSLLILVSCKELPLTRYIEHKRCDVAEATGFHAGL